jgi:radical SAM superfamily enzyme YgiQ (UPF0313 family)
VVRELQALYDLGYRGHIDFVDDNFIGDKTNVRGLLPAILEWSAGHGYPFYFSTEASIDLARDTSILQMMKDVDFRYVFLGLETPEDSVLRGINKRQNVNRPIAEAVKTISSYGMVVNAGFIIGLDGESANTADSLIGCIQDAGICMAMLGKLCALPNTKLTRRLEQEGRLFHDGIEELDGSEVDQMTGGLNFVTSRPRLDILRDYQRIMERIYSPGSYYKRVMRTGRNLRRAGKHKPGLREMLSTARAMSRLTRRVGFDRSTGLLYWRMLGSILMTNPRAIEATVNLAAMYIHFRKESEFVVELTRREITRLEEENGRRRAAA